MNNVGRIFKYVTHSGKHRIALCTGSEFNSSLGKVAYTGVSPYGHKVVLSEDECEFKEEN